MSIASLAPDYIRAIMAYQPGKPISELAREMGIAESSIVKLASNENPLGMSARARDAALAALADVARYPDGGAFALKAALCAKFDVRPEQLVVGNGSNDILELVAQAFLAPNIEDDPNNTTRFLVIADHDAGQSGQDRTSLVFSTPNRPGAIHGLLEPLARHGVDLTKLQSRPARSGLWEYVFYADVNGHREDAQVAAALQELNERAAFVKIIGSYPVAAI